MTLFADVDNLVYFQRNVEQHPNDPQSWCKMAIAIQQAEQHLRNTRASQQSPGAPEMEGGGWQHCSRLALLHALELQPKRAKVCLQIAQGLLALNEIAAANAALDRCIDLDRHIAEAHEILAHNLLASGEIQVAVDRLGHGVRHNPESVPLRVLYASALRRLERFDEALGHASFAVERDPQNKEAGIEQAEILGLLGHDQDSLTAWKQLRGMHPDCCTVATAYGKVLLQCRQYEDAARVFASFVDHCSQSTEIRLKLGYALCELGKVEAAQQYARWALRVDNQCAFAHYLQARCYELRKLDDKAVESYECSVQLDPKLADAFHCLGMLLFRKGDTRAAQRALVQATANAPEDERIARDLRLVLRRTTGAVFRRPSMLAQQSAFAGNLSQFSVDEALEFLRNQRASGDFCVVSEGGQAHLRLRDGMIIRATSSRCPRLPELLLVHEYLTSGDLESFAHGEDEVDSAEELELRLVSSGKLKRDQIDHLLAKQIREVITDLIDWTEGNFEFSRVDVTNDPSQTAQDPAGVLLDVYRIRDEASQSNH